VFIEIRDSYSIVRELCPRCPGTLFRPRCPGTQQLSIAEEAYLTEEKYTLIVPILTKLAEEKLRATGQKLFRTEYVDLKRKLLDALMDIFCSPMQIPTFEWTIEKLKELEMIPHHFSALEMESYCALGRWS